MTNQLHEAWHTIVPPNDDKYGVLSPIFLLLTVVTGLVDAFSYLLLGHVFVANMTGNVVFLGFALAGAPGFAAWSSILAIGAFVLGSLLGGRISHRFASHRARLLTAITVEVGLVLAAFVVASVAASGSNGARFDATSQAVLIALVGAAMGIQNATARSIGVPDLTTTVLTLTIVGIAADGRVAGGPDSRGGRRFLSVLSIFVGALTGAALVAVHLDAFVLLLATLLLVVAVVLCRRVAA
jgi:uncharacterized membrane protein YoaK (UPF0700 family)